MANDVTINIHAKDLASGVLKGISVGIAGMAVGMTAALGASLKMTLDWGQSLDDIGDILGTTAKQSAGLGAMFQTIGGDTNQLTSSLALMTRGLLNADGKLGPTGTALKSLGVKFTDAKGKILPATDIFQAVADKIGVMPDGLEKTSLMMDIFGKSGKEMGDALAAASNGGMADYIKKADEMGLAIDSDQVIETKKSFETLKLTFTGIAVQVGSKLLPIIQKVMTILMKLFNSPAFQAGVKTAIELIGKLADVFSVVFDDLMSGDYGVAFDDLKEGLLSIVPPELQDKFIAVSSAVSTAINWIRDTIQTGLTWIQQFWADNGAAIIAQVTEFWEVYLKPMFSAGLTFIQTLISFVLENIKKFWADHGVAIIQGVTDLWETIKTIFSTATIFITDIFNAFTLLMQGNFDGFSAYLQAAWNILWEIIKGAAHAAWAFIVSGFASAFSDVLKNVDRIIAAVKIALDWLSQLTNSQDLAGGRGGFGTNNTVPGKASGGYVNSGRPYMVGERGPELFMPRQSGTIIPNNQLGGDTYNINTKDNPAAIVAAVQHFQRVQRLMA